MVIALRLTSASVPTLTVKKRSGNREVFDRDKLRGAVKRSVGKFFNSEFEIDLLAQ